MTPYFILFQINGNKRINVKKSLEHTLNMQANQQTTGNTKRRV